MHWGSVPKGRDSLRRSELNRIRRCGLSGVHGRQRRRSAEKSGNSFVHGVFPTGRCCSLAALSQRTATHTNSSEERLFPGRLKGEKSAGSSHVRIKDYDASQTTVMKRAALFGRANHRHADHFAQNPQTTLGAGRSQSGVDVTGIGGGTPITSPAASGWSSAKLE